MSVANGAGWRTLFAEVPREPFIPDDIWVKDDGGHLVSVSRDRDSERWAGLVASDHYLVTQLDEGREPDGHPPSPTSSSSMPTVVALMLDALDIGSGHSVLEVGTGTGWNAALLCHRVGRDGTVVTVEVDPVLARQASRSLDRAGYRPRVVTGDGLLGCPAHAPYDRVIATAAFREVVPTAWLDQLRAGGRLVGPWSTDWTGALLALDKRHDGSATGRFLAPLSFMRIRSQRISTYGWEPENDEIAERPSTVTRCLGDDGDAMFNPDRARFALGARIPDSFLYIGFDACGERHHVVELDDGRTRSFARLDWNVDSAQPYTVQQIGPRRLWDEAEFAYDWWHEQGEPGMDRFGLEIRGDRQWVWLDEPGNEVRTMTWTASTR